MKLSIALSTVVAVLAASVAVAAPAPVGNFITLHLGPSVGQFRGAVKSDVLDCIADRKVRIVRVSGDDTRVGVGFTDRRGHFNIQTNESSGDWIAKVKRTPIGNGYVCAGARSKIRSAG
jgi:hypothetical protein